MTEASKRSAHVHHMLATMLHQRRERVVDQLQGGNATLDGRNVK